MIVRPLCAGLLATAVCLALVGTHDSNLAEAVGAPPMCQGQPATIVTTDESSTTGTDGPDVIVARWTEPSVRFVHGEGGDDLICVTGPAGINDYHESGEVNGGEGHDSLRITLSDGTDRLTLDEYEKLNLQALDGFDTLRLGDAFGRGKINGGANGARIYVGNHLGKIQLDMPDKSLRVDDNVGVYKLTNVSNATVYARRAILTGSSVKNALAAHGCNITIRGGYGSDTLWATASPLACTTTRRAKILGGPGDDRMQGPPSDDVLLGGPGKDRARGGDGVDRCEAERKRNCEK